MFNGKEDFKFYVNEDQVFHLEKALLDNKIEFHNELGIGTNIRTNKYYIKNSDRPKFDKICKKIQIDIFIDSIPEIETRLPNIKLNYIQIAIIILSLIVLLILLL